MHPSSTLSCVVPWMSIQLHTCDARPLVTAGTSARPSKSFRTRCFWNSYYSSQVSMFWICNTPVVRVFVPKSPMVAIFAASGSRYQPLSKHFFSSATFITLLVACNFSPLPLPTSNSHWNWTRSHCLTSRWFGTRSEHRANNHAQDSDTPYFWKNRCVTPANASPENYITPLLKYLSHSRQYKGFQTWGEFRTNWMRTCTANSSHSLLNA